MFALVCILSANTYEPLLERKTSSIQKLTDCFPPFFANDFVVKPERLCGSLGVGKETPEWNLQICEIWSKEPCLRQPFHPGPWELRFTKSLTWSAEGFIAGWQDRSADAPAFQVDVHDFQDILSCVDRRIPELISFDLRANSKTEFLLCEVNGAFGIDYSWVVGRPNVVWLLSRIQAGVGFFERGLLRAMPAVHKVLRRWELSKTWEFERF